MRILHVIHSAKLEGGGPIEGVKQLSQLNIGAGHAVELLTLDDPREPWLKAVPMPVHAVGPSWLSYGYTPRLVPWLREHRREYDVVAVNGIWQFSSFGVWWALHGTGTPYVVFPHGMLDPWFKRHYPLKHLKKWLYWPWGDYRVLRGARAVFFTSEEERVLARQSFWLYRAREIVLSYGINAPERCGKEQAEIFLAKFPALRGRRILLYLGRLHEKKGGDLLLRAFARLTGDRVRAGGSDWQLVMAGPDDSDYALQLKNLARDLGIESSVTWPGLLRDDLKWGAFRAADAFVLPSHQENFGIAVAEALACGTPVLITNKVNIWREIHAHGAGLVENDDQAGIDTLLKRWAAMKEEVRAKVRENTIGCFRTCFDARHFADSFIRTLVGFTLAARGHRGVGASAPLAVEPSIGHQEAPRETRKLP